MNGGLRHLSLMIPVPGAPQWTVVTRCAVPRVLSCELPVSCDLQLPQESATNTCRFDIGEPCLRPNVFNDRLDNTSHVHRINVSSSFPNIICAAMSMGNTSVLIANKPLRKSERRNDFYKKTMFSDQLSDDTLIFKIQ